MFPDFFDRVMKESTSVSGHSSPVSSNRSELFVVSVGGSLLFADNQPNVEAVRRIAGSINRLAQEGYKFALVVGGGAMARAYIKAAQDLGATQFSLDELGIAVTRANALLFIQALSKAHPHVVTQLEQASTVLEKGKIPVFGGLMPGFTTDTVAALVAEKLGGTFINLSNVDGVYSADPRENKKAKLFREVSFEQLFDIVASLEANAGYHGVIDIPASLILKRSRIPSIFVNGNSLENFEFAVRGQSFNGTIVQTSEDEINQTERQEEKEE